MALTKKDLEKINEMIEVGVNTGVQKGINDLWNRLLPYLRQFPTRQEMYEKMASKEDLNEVKKDVNELKDQVARLEDKFDKGFNLLKFQVEQNTEDIKFIKSKLDISLY